MLLKGKVGVEQEACLRFADRMFEMVCTGFCGKVIEVDRYIEKICEGI